MRFSYRRTGDADPRPQAFFTYFGGKHSTIANYPAPKYPLIIEPFAGSAAYATYWYDRAVILIDKYKNITDVWEYLIGATAGDVLRIPLTLEDALRVPGAAGDLIRWWMKKGETKPSAPSTRYSSKTRPDSHWGSVIRHRISKNVGKIKHWQIVRGDYWDAPDVEATWFIDPPYQRSGKAYVHSADSIDYGQLAGWTKSRKGQVIACGQLGDDWLPFSPLLLGRNVRNVGTKSYEMIWENKR